jgi:Sulfotransferase domain
MAGKNGSEMMRLAMWSGPRNISTAMMRSWGNRDDTVVCDEPLYAYYLNATRKPHPGLEEVIAAGETDWRKVAEDLTGPIPCGKQVWYQKHMTHHLLPEVSREWLGQVTNCFLIRNPREMLASYVKIVEAPELLDSGFPQQTEIFEWVRKHAGRVPPVLDSADVLKSPRRMLGLLCHAIGIEFQEAMLAWPPGPRTTDGVWAKHWYGEVEKSTCFRPYQPKQIDLPDWLQPIYRQCLEHYERLYEHRLK